MNPFFRKWALLLGGLPLCLCASCAKANPYGPSISRKDALSALAEIEKAVAASDFVLPKSYTMTQKGLAAILILPLPYTETDIYDPAANYCRREIGNDRYWVYQEESGAIISAKDVTRSDSSSQSVETKTYTRSISATFSSEVEKSRVYLLSRSLSGVTGDVRSAPEEAYARLSRFETSDSLTSDNETYAITNEAYYSSGAGLLSLNFSVKEGTSGTQDYCYQFKDSLVQTATEHSGIITSGATYQWDVAEKTYPDLSTFTLTE
jgi:hypothetical protein